MEPGDTPPAGLSEPKVLAAGSAHGHRVELHEYLDGTIVIMRDGAKQAVFELGACKLESCIKSYMGFLRSCVENNA